MESQKNLSLWTLACFLLIFWVQNAVSHKLDPNLVELESFADRVDLLEKLALSDLKVVKYFILARNNSRADEELLHRIDRYIHFFKLGNGNVTSYTKKEATRIAENPISAFGLLRRYAHDLQYIFELPVEEFFEKASKAVLPHGSKFPDEIDVLIATEGLLRLQQVYDITSRELLDGNFSGKFITEARLDHIMCFEIGQRALRLHFYTLAIEWLELAKETLVITNPLDLTSEDSTNQLLGHSKYLHDRHFEKGNELDTYTFDRMFDPEKSTIPALATAPKKPGDRISRRKILYDQYRGNKTADKINFEINLYAVCSGENFQTARQKAGLFCWYEFKSHPRLLIGPMKMEFLNQNPDVVQIYDIIGEAAIKRVKRATKDKRTLMKDHLDLGKRKPQGKEEYETKGYGVYNWVWDGVGNRYGLLSLAQNLEAATGYKTTTKTEAKPLFVKSYTYAVLSVPHVDKKDIVTAIHYLIDTDYGGYTAFPLLGFAVRPIKGSVVFWHNYLHQDGNLDPSLKHESCPVIFGRKMIATKAILASKEQVKNLKCSLTPQRRYKVLVNGRERS